MISKKILAMGLGVALSMTAVSAIAGNSDPGLTLSSQGAPHQIVVTCNGYPALYNIPASGSLPAFAWGAIYLMFHFHNNLKCTFTENTTGALIGKANLTLTGLLGTTGEISNIRDVASGYTVTVTPSAGTFNTSTQVALQYS